MLGYLLGIMLVLTVSSSVIITEVFADSITVEFDKESYYLGDTLFLSGEIFDLGMPIIAISVYDPNGKILSANNIEISPDKSFSKYISLDSPFYEKIGEYTVKLDYGQISENYYFVVEGENSESTEVIINNDLEDNPEIILLYADKVKYTDNDVITITGLISKLDEPTVLIGVYDPSGAPVGFYFGDVDSNLEFSTNFLVKAGVNFRMDGTYSIKAYYAETEKISYFDFQQDLVSETEDETGNNPTEEELQKILDELISELEDIESQQKNNKEETTDKNNDPVSETSSTDNSQSNTSTSKGNSIVKSVDEEISIKQQPTNSAIQKIKSTNGKNNSNENISQTPVKKNTNLSVEDIELGKLLNQINLDCDSSTFTDTISYYDGMGPALYRLCKFDSSLNFFNESLIENPTNVEILVNKGSTLGKLGYFSEAIIHYDQAIKFDPTFLPAKNNKANALANLGNLDEAISLYNEILEKNPDYSTARTNLLTATSLIPQTNNILDLSPPPNLENVIFEESSLMLDNSDLNNSEIPSSPNFLDDVSSAFSSLSSLFDFLN